MSAPEDRVSCRYGAPMGRGNSDEPLAGKVRLRRVKFYDGDYDKGGAYWGDNGVPLYYAEGSEGGYCYVRAMSREHAKAIIAEVVQEGVRYYR